MREGEKAESGALVLEELEAALAGREGELNGKRGISTGRVGGEGFGCRRGRLRSQGKTPPARQR